MKFTSVIIWLLFLFGQSAYALSPEKIIELTNAERVKNGLPELRESRRLDISSRLKAMDCWRNNYFAHVSPDGIEPWYWFDEVQYDNPRMAENLAINFHTEKQVVNALMKSPSHRKNILNSHYSEIGVWTKGSLVVQHFGGEL